MTTSLNFNNGINGNAEKILLQKYQYRSYYPRNKDYINLPNNFSTIEIPIQNVLFDTAN